MAVTATTARRTGRDDAAGTSEPSYRWRPVELDGRGVTFVDERPGPRGAPTVVLLHGWIATGASNWTGALDALGEHYHVVAMDHRGHGRGIRSRSPFTLEDCAEDVVALLDELRVRSAVLVGYSMGGPIAQLAWRRHPERVDALVMLATAANFVGVPTSAPVHRAAGALVSATFAVTRPAVRTTAWATDPSQRAAGPVDDSLLAGLGRHDPAAVGRALSEIVRYDSRPWLGEIDVPTAVVVTTRDRAVPPARQRALAAGVPDAALLELDGTHLAPFTDPTATTNVLLDACAQVRPGRTRRGRLAAWMRAKWSRRR